MISFAIFGDIVNYEKADGIVCSDSLTEVIVSADCSVCNFEAPIAGGGKKQPKSGKHHFQLAETVDGLKKQGFDLLLLANNHIMDFGEAGLKATIDRIVSCELKFLGAGLSFDDAYRPVIQEIQGYKVGMINACEAQFGVLDNFNRLSSAGYAWISHPLIDNTIINLKKLCDFVIVFSHAGLEFYPIPQKEWRTRYRHFCDLGADVVVGTHPHVPQGYENYENSLIFYSLGNFYFDSEKYRFKEDSTYAVWLEFGKDTPLFFKPIFHYKSNGVVSLAPPEKRIDLNALCRLLGAGYEDIHDQMSLEAYDSIRRNLLYSLMHFPYDGSLFSSIRRIAGDLLKRRKKTDKDLLQLHLLRNEAYYYAARHALEVKVRAKDKNE